MVIHPTISCLIVCDQGSETRLALGAYLESMNHLRLTVRSQLPADIRPFDVIVTARTALLEDAQKPLTEFVRNGGGWLALVDALESGLPDLFGVQPSAVGPEAELRVLFKNAGDPMAQRLPEAIYVAGRYQRLQESSADAEVILYADWHYEHSPVLTMRRSGAGAAACTTLQAYEHPDLRRILYRTIRRLAGAAEKNDDLKAGLLGYPPWLGRYHATAVYQTAGLGLTAICDINPRRLQIAADAFPQVSRHSTAEDLAADANVDLVIVSTPPDSHCRLSLQMMAAGKHVVCEKPLALNRHETGKMADMAEKRQVHLSCHQNRRWDADYLAIKQALDEGAIGDIFYLETFVGGFNHPCGYWHSEASVSGGLSYDWGGHYLDWITGLMPDAPVSVIGTRHKRVWHDVTNADQERIQIRFAGGQEAEFIHSDIAAAMKPKWYLLGTRGAIVGNWQTSTALTTDPVVYYREEAVPITEKPPDLILYRRQVDGLVYSRRLALPRQAFGFHRSLADHLLTGEPLGAPLADSMTVIAILEAAARSAANGGCVEKIDG